MGERTPWAERQKEGTAVEKSEWVMEQLQKLYDQTNDYNQMTLVKAAQDLIREQVKRIEQMEGEIEGTIWSPRRWGE